MNEPIKLERYIAIGWKGLSLTNIPAYLAQVMKKMKWWDFA
jgi:hypothetical protein